jgi:hypothetical protein
MADSFLGYHAVRFPSKIKNHADTLVSCPKFRFREKMRERVGKKEEEAVAAADTDLTHCSALRRRQGVV